MWRQATALSAWYMTFLVSASICDHFAAPTLVAFVVGSVTGPISDLVQTIVQVWLAPSEKAPDAE